MPEPQEMTLAEAIVAVTDKGMWLEAYRLNDGRTKWTVWHEPNPSDLYQPESGLVCHATVYTWPDAASAALGVPVVARDEAAELRAANNAFVAFMEQHHQLIAQHLPSGVLGSLARLWNQAAALAAVGEEQ